MVLRKWFKHGDPKPLQYLEIFMSGIDLAYQGGVKKERRRAHVRYI
jgi:hypothetical protein